MPNPVAGKELANQLLSFFSDHSFCEGSEDQVNVDVVIFILADHTDDFLDF